MGENLYNIRDGVVMKITDRELQHESLKRRYSVVHGRPLFCCDLSVILKTVSISLSVNWLIFSSMSILFSGGTVTLVVIMDPGGHVWLDHRLTCRCSSVTGAPGATCNGAGSGWDYKTLKLPAELFTAEQSPEQHSAWPTDQCLPEDSSSATSLPQSLPPSLSLSLPACLTIRIISEANLCNSNRSWEKLSVCK